MRFRSSSGSVRRPSSRSRSESRLGVAVRGRKGRGGRAWARGREGRGSPASASLSGLAAAKEILRKSPNHGSFCFVSPLVCLIHGPFFPLFPRLAKKGQIASARAMAKALVKQRNAVNRIYQAKANIQQVGYEISNMSAQLKMTKVMGKSAAVMHSCNELLKIGEPPPPSPAPLRISYLAPH